MRSRYSGSSEFNVDHLVPELLPLLVASEQLLVAVFRLLCTTLERRPTKAMVPILSKPMLTLARSSVLSDLAIDGLSGLFNATAKCAPESASGMISSLHAYVSECDAKPISALQISQHKQVRPAASLGI